MTKEYQYNNELRFEWGKYGSEIGYYLTKEIITSYEREKGLYLAVNIELEEKIVNGIKLTIIDLNNKFDKDTINNIICKRIIQIIDHNIEVIGSTIEINEKDVLESFIEKTGIIKYFSIKKLV